MVFTLSYEHFEQSFHWLYIYILRGFIWRDLRARKMTGLKLYNVTAPYLDGAMVMVFHIWQVSYNLRIVLRLYKCAQ